jgi:hypothetical protein
MPVFAKTLSEFIPKPAAKTEFSSSETTEFSTVKIARKELAQQVYYSKRRSVVFLPCRNKKHDF